MTSSPTTSSRMPTTVQRPTRAWSRPGSLPHPHHGAPAAEAVAEQAHSLSAVEAVLRESPSHGWTAGWIGRRDRALLVLSQLAGLSCEEITTITAGDMTITGGVATIRRRRGRTTTGSRDTTTLRSVDDGLLCGPCALARWVHALDLTVVYPEGRVIAAVIGRAVPLTSHSPHLCHSNNAITEVTARAALLPPIDQWEHPVQVSVTPEEHALVLRARVEQLLGSPSA